MPAVPKPLPKLKKKPKPLRAYRKREPSQPTPGLFAKPKEYDRKEDLLSTKKVFERDNNLCQWDLRVLNRHVRGTQVHHIYGRRRRWDIRSKILLCFKHHECYHKALPDEEGNPVTKEGFEMLIEEIYAGL